MTPEQNIDMTCWKLLDTSIGLDAHIGLEYMSQYHMPSKSTTVNEHMDSGFQPFTQPQHYSSVSRLSEWYHYPPNKPESRSRLRLIFLPKSLLQTDAKLS